jgi:hypothetical protein
MVVNSSMTLGPDNGLKVEIIDCIFPPSVQAMTPKHRNLSIKRLTDTHTVPKKF